MKKEVSIQESDLVFVVFMIVSIALATIIFFRYTDIYSYNDLPLDGKILTISSVIFALSGFITSIIIGAIEKRNRSKL